jgi:hypothetical protein
VERSGLRTVTRRRTKDLVRYLEDRECGEVLAQLLERHPVLRSETNVIAESLLGDVSAEVTSKEVARQVRDLDVDRLWGRTGRKPWGYVEPGEAAWELLERVVERVQNDMKRRMRAGMESAAEMLCQGIVLGLYDVEKSGGVEVVDCAPDFPLETAAYTVSTLVKMYPKSRRRAAGRRIIDRVEQRCGEWVNVLQRVVEEAVPSGKRTRKRR